MACLRLRLGCQCGYAQLDCNLHANAEPGHVSLNFRHLAREPCDQAVYSASHRTVLGHR
jgi:hypothetical protein